MASARGGVAKRKRALPPFKHVLAEPRRAVWEEIDAERAAEVVGAVKAALGPIRRTCRDVLCGLGQVTRAMERGEVAVAVVVKRTAPAGIVSHVPLLAHARAVPLCVLPGTTAELGAALGLQTCVAVAVRAGSADSDAANAAETLLRYAELPTVPWLPAPGSLPVYEPANIAVDPNSAKRLKRAAREGAGAAPT